MSDLQALLAAELTGLASTLAPIDEASWAQPSLCEGWTVRHVVAHLTMAARYDAERFGAELAADGFDFQVMSDRIAERDAALPPAALLDDLSHVAPDGGGCAESVQQEHCPGTCTAALAPDH